MLVSRVKVKLSCFGIIIHFWVTKYTFSTIVNICSKLGISFTPCQTTKIAWITVEAKRQLWALSKSFK